MDKWAGTRISEQAVSKRGQENMSDSFLWNRKRRLQMSGLRSQGGQRSYNVGNGEGVERE